MTVTVTGRSSCCPPGRARLRSAYLCRRATWCSGETAHGDVVSSAPMFVAPCLNCTPATPMLSDALALTWTAPETEAPSAGAVSVTFGGVVSATAVVVNVEFAEVARLPAASRDFTRKLYRVPGVRLFTGTACDVILPVLSVVLEPYPVVNPYSTCESAGSLVVQPIVAAVV